MERRHDLLFRQVVDQVGAGLAASGFRVFDRGWLGEYRWIEFARQRWNGGGCPREEHLVLYHLADHCHIGARLQSCNPIERTRPGEVIMNLWDYELAAAETPMAKAALCRRVRGWVDDTLARIP